MVADHSLLRCCPACEASLTDTDVTAGHCTQCGALLRLWLHPDTLIALLEAALRSRGRKAGA